MPIMANTLYHDMLNFFRNHFVNIILLVFLISLISVILGYALIPNDEQLMNLREFIHAEDGFNINLQQLIHQMSVKQKYIFLKFSIAGILVNLINNVLLVGVLLTMIHLISDRQSFSILTSINLFLSILPRLLLIIFLTTLLIQLGLLFFIVPGIILSIALSLAPIIIISDNLTVIQSMCLSANIAFTNHRILTIAILFWFLSKMIILFLATKLIIKSSLLISLLFNNLNNLISALLLIYLYRLYMLLRQN